MNESARSEGRIIPQNVALMQELAAEAEMMDRGYDAHTPVQRVYVDAKLLDEDPDKYKFVSENVDEFDDHQEAAIQNSPSNHRDMDRYEDYTQEADPGPDLQSERQSSRRGPGSSYKPMYVVRGNTGNSNRSRGAHVAMTDEEREEQELRHEEMYQSRMREKLAQQQEKTSQIHIPKLDLADSDEESPKKSNKAPMDISLRDSIEDLLHNPQVQEEPLPQDSLEWGNVPQYNSNRQDVNPYNSTRNDADPYQQEQQYQYQETPHYDQTPHYVDQTPHQDYQTPHNADPYAPTANYQAGDDPRLRMMFQQQPAPQNYEGLPRNKEPDAYTRYEDRNGYIDQPEADQNAPFHGQQYPQPRTNLAEGQNDYGEVQQGGNLSYVVNEPRQHKPVPDQPLIHRNRFEDWDYDPNDTKVRKPNIKEFKKYDKNFIEANKASPKKPPVGKTSYLQSLNNKKKKEPTSGRSTGTGNHPESDEKPNSAEALWQKRSNSLASAKEAKLANRKGSKKGTLRKFPSESRVDDMNRPHRVEPLPHSRLRPQEAYTEPIKSEPSPRGYPGDANTHTIYTENGQQFNVDVNLKVLSPPPPGGYGHPQNGGYHGNHNQPPPIMKPLGPIPTRDNHPPPPQRDPYEYAPPPQNHYQPHNQYGYHGNGYPDPYAAPPREHYQDQYGYEDQNQPPYQPPPQPGYHPQQQQYQQQPYQQQQYPPQQYQQQQYPQQYHHQAQLNSPQHRANPPQQEPYYPQQDEQSERSDSNTYRVLPPIGSADTDKATNKKPTKQKKPARAPDNEDKREVSPRLLEGSYMNAYKTKKTQKVEYKEYSLEDYRKMKKEVRLGGLGPDLDSDTLKERREKAIRQQQYARQINERNRQQAETNKHRPREEPEYYPDEPEREREERMKKRVAAIEYAKSVPKPKVRPRFPPEGNTSDRQSTGRSGTQRGSQRGSTGGSKTSQPQNTEDLMDDLEKLQQRHLAEKEKAAAIQQNLEGVPAH